MFPVQRVAKIEASRAAAIFFFSTLFFFSMKILSIFRRKKKFVCKIEKKGLQSHLFEPPGRSTGNRIIFMDSLRAMGLICGIYSFKSLYSNRMRTYLHWVFGMTPNASISRCRYQQIGIQKPLCTMLLKHGF